ncbi:MAG: hypothetical protein KatS3mg024_0125 [Armatimonadota bacterium]|nr:MAG: hypothetical protein KatS3mg024_0125 [Armatimonadota bacterium]
MRIIFRLQLAAALAAAWQLPALCAVFYVSPSGSDSAGGHSWATAKRTIAAAVSAAAYGDEVWVATGIYTTPVSLRSGVAVYCGFAGGEGSRDHRDPATHPVTLTVPGPGPAVYIYAGASVFTRIEGLRISGCGGDGIRAPEGSATIKECEITGNSGAGLVCDAGSLIVDRCRITGNLGAGVLCENYAAPHLWFSTISGNAGGGVVCTGESAPLVDRCFIRNNGADGILCLGSSPVIQGCVITGTSGAGVSCQDGSAPVLINNTIAASQGTGLALESGASATNNIVAFNGTGIAVQPGADAPALLRNCVYGNSGGDYVGVGPGTGDVRADPQFVALSAGDVRIRPSSPCRDAGDDAAASSLATDIEGRTRKIGAAVDMGAYELDAGLPAVSGIPEARLAPPGTPAEGIQGIVSAAWSGVFYLQREDRACGIRVEQSAHTLQPGDRASVSGTVAITGSGEPCLMATSSAREGSGTLRAVAVKGKALQPGTGITPAGLLVRIAGRVTHRDSQGSSFTVDDGSGLQDGIGHPGVRVSCPGTALPPAGACVVVTGVCSWEQPEGTLRPVILPRTGQDIVTVSP